MRARSLILQLSRHVPLLRCRLSNFCTVTALCSGEPPRRKSYSGWINAALKTYAVHLRLCFLISKGSKSHLIPEQLSLLIHCFCPSDFRRDAPPLATYRNKVPLDGSSPSQAHKSEEMFVCWRKKGTHHLLSLRLQTTERLSLLLSRAAMWSMAVCLDLYVRLNRLRLHRKKISVPIKMKNPGM